MHDLEGALSDIRTMRSQLARSTPFRGYSAPAFAVTGLIAFGAAVAQPYWIAQPTADVTAYLALWSGTAALCAVLIGFDVIARSRRAHSGLEDEMILAALEQLLPAVVAGALLTYVIQRFAPQTSWMLPGLWQILLSLGIFASCRSLPAPLIALGVWYLATGLACVAFANHANALTPWAMGIPFTVGQFLAAVLIYKFGGGDADG